MLVPGHVCSLYVATGGANGPALGSDEKEIVLLDYSVIDVLTNEVSHANEIIMHYSNLLLLSCNSVYFFLFILFEFYFYFFRLNFVFFCSNRTFGIFQIAILYIFCC